VIHGNNAGELLEDEAGFRIMQVTGRNIAWLIKTLAAGKEKVPVRRRTSGYGPILSIGP
jgi:hypothetical protein